MSLFACCTLVLLTLLEICPTENVVLYTIGKPTVTEALYHSWWKFDNILHGVFFNYRRVFQRRKTSTRSLVLGSSKDWTMSLSRELLICYKNSNPKHLDSDRKTYIFTSLLSPTKLKGKMRCSYRQVRQLQLWNSPSVSV